MPPATPARLLADLPPGVAWAPWPAEGPLLDDGLPAVYVPRFGDRERTRAHLAALRDLRWVQTLSAGVDWVLDLVPPGVPLHDARGVHDVAVAEWVVGALLVLARELDRYAHAQAARAWLPWRSVVAGELDQKRVLILGYGAIGRALEARLGPLGARVWRLARRGRPGVYGPEALDALLPRADAVVLLLPLTEETRGLVDRRFLAKMRPGAHLVNAGRGALVVTDALVEALYARRIKAALDVTDPEPLPADHPLWTAPGLFLTPHVAGASPAFLARAYNLVKAQLARYLEGRPLWNRVQSGY